MENALESGNPCRGPESGATGNTMGNAVGSKDRCRGPESGGSANLGEAPWKVEAGVECPNPGTLQKRISG